MLRVLNQLNQETALASLDHLIARLRDVRLGNANDGQRNLLIEHLTTARAMLLGAMPEECVTNLRLARDTAGTLSGKPLQSEVKEAISDLLDSVPDLPPAEWRHHPRENHRPPVSAAPVGLTGFFQGPDAGQSSGASHGIFYPKKHVVVVFSSFESAKAACQGLRNAGYADHEVLAVPGDEVIRFFNELRGQSGIWSELFTQLSWFLDTEASLVGRYAGWAKEGSGFLIVYSPTETEASDTADLLHRFEPMSAHWFTSGYIRQLV